MKKIIIIALTAAVSLTAFAGCGSSNGGKVLNFYNWGDYIDPSLITQFENETGIHVNVDNFATNEDMYTKIKGGGANYDLAIPSDYMIEKMINEDMLEPIDLTAVPNYSNIDDRFKNLVYDPTNEYSVPYMWGTLGILYNKTMVSDPVDSWDILWNPKYTGQIFMYSSMRDSMAAAQKKLGYSLNTTNVTELLNVKDALIAQKPLVKAYKGDDVKDSMIGNEAALALVYSGDAVYCEGENPDRDYAIPNEGSNVWFDSLVILKGAAHKTAAEQFINFLCDPQVAAQNAKYIGYSTVETAAFDLLPDELKNNPAYWPSDEDFANCEVFNDLGDAQKNYSQIWTEITMSN